MLVKQILSAKDTQGILSVKKDQTVLEAVQLMSAHRIGTVMVSPDGASIDGILSERDVVRETGKRGVEAMLDPVEAVMTSKIITCREDQTALEILQIMTDGRFRHMPVLRDGSMVGLISIGDVVKGRVSELAMEKDALEGMIMGH